MLKQLRQVTQIISIAQNQQQMLEVLVSEVCRALDVEACSVYVADEKLKYFTLMASQGLKPEGSKSDSSKSGSLKSDGSESDYTGRVKVGYKDGLVSLIGQPEESLIADGENSYPSFQNIPEFKDRGFKAFLGVPIIHQRNLFGVLTIQQKKRRRFAVDEETFLITLAAQISPVLSRGNNNQLLDLDENEVLSRKIRGIAASPGVVIGRAQVVFPSENIHAIPDRKTQDIEAELEALSSAVKTTHDQLEKMCSQMSGKVSDQEIALFKAYQQILGSKGLADEVAKVIHQGYWAATALRKVVQNHLNTFDAIEDSYLRERGHDLEDLANRVLTHLLSSSQSHQSVQPGTIIVAGNITAGMIAELPIQNIVGIVSLKGSSTSHATILVKALGIPAIMGLDSCPITQIDNQELILDGYNGQLYIAPDERTIEQYQKLLQEEKQLNAELTRDESLPNMTKDGLLISLMINNSLGVDAKKVARINVDGIGLFRTEIPFMQLDTFPSEEEQTIMYRQVMDDFESLPITIRTLDIGGDKQLSYFPIKEDNPFLGWRGVRVTLEHTEIFLVQLRAIFRASINREGLKIVLPMVSTVKELNQCLDLIDQAYLEIEEQFLEDNDKLYRPLIGFILEVPASIFLLDHFVNKIDFVSIGTNDLIQYLMAVDRGNLKVKNLYNHFQPGVIEVLRRISIKCHELKLSVQVCGEMAADPMAVLLLVGMGYYDLSMNIGSLIKVRRAISQFTLAEMQQFVRDCGTFESATDIQDYLFRMIEGRGLGGLVRAGN